jgi:hypothetical protein
LEADEELKMAVNLASNSEINSDCWEAALEAEPAFAALDEVQHI